MAKKDNVIALDAVRPMVTGPARCVQCGHGWDAVFPAGEWWIECPRCHATKAHSVYHVSPPEGEKRWRCTCGCQVFYVMPSKVLCVNCGRIQ